MPQNSFVSHWFKGRTMKYSYSWYSCCRRREGQAGPRLLCEENCRSAGRAVSFLHSVQKVIWKSQCSSKAKRSRKENVHSPYAHSANCIPSPGLQFFFFRYDFFGMWVRNNYQWEESYKILLSGKIVQHINNFKRRHFLIVLTFI